MTTLPSSTPTSGPTSSESARRLLASACNLFAAAGPAAVSLRDVASHAGCNHALVARHFGGRNGLELQVAAEIRRRLDVIVDQACAHPGDPAAKVMELFGSDDETRQLLIRCGLGELPIDALTTPGNPLAQLGRCLAAAATPVAPTATASLQALRAYGATAIVVGWLTFEPFVVEATGLHELFPTQRHDAVAHAVRVVASLQSDPTGPTMTATGGETTSPSGSHTPPRGRTTTRQALIAAAVDLFTTRSPASVTTRELADHAGVNQGLIYRHFGSKEAIITAALDAGIAGLLPPTETPTGFDLAGVVTATRHRTPAAVLIARTLVDGIDIAAVRTDFPVVHRLLATFDPLTTGSGLSDPRLAVAVATSLVAGSAVWDATLRTTMGIAGDVNVDAPLTQAAAAILAVPTAG